MKKTAKLLVTLLFSLSILTCCALPAFAASLGQVKSAKASTVTYNSVTLTWGKVSGASGYEVEQYKGKKWVSVNAKVTKTSLTVSKLTTGTTYKFRIRAYKNNWLGKKSTFGKYSSTVSVTPKPAKVTGLKASSITTTTAKLTWTKVSGASGYYVQQYSSKKWKTIKTTTSNSYSLSKLKLGTTYKYRVIAYRTVSKKEIQGAASATLSVKTVVPTPSAINASSVKTSSVKLSWGKSSGADGYYVEQYKSGKWTQIKKTTSTSLTVSSLAAGTKYSFRVCAYKSSYKSAYTATKDVTTTCAAPTSLAVKDVEDTTATLSWKKVTGATGYTVYKYDAASKKYTSYKTTTALSLALTGLKPTTEYKFYVVAYHSANGSQLNSSASNVVTFKTFYDTVDNLKYTCKSEALMYYWLEWNKINDKTIYTVEKYDYAQKKYVVDKEEYIPTNYYITLRGVDESSKINLKTTQSTSSNYTTVSWNKVDGAEKYLVQTRTSGSTASWETKLETTSNTAKLLLAPDTKFDIRVVIFNGKYRVLAFQEGAPTVKTNYSYISGVPSLISEICSVETNPAPKFDKTSNESKTLYTLKLVQAINNTKMEKSTVTSTMISDVETEIDKCTVKYGILKFDNLDAILKYFGGDSSDITDDLTEHTETTYTFTNGFSTTTNENGYSVQLNSFLAPSNQNAYLYKDQDVNNFAKKISDVTYSKSGSKETVQIKIKTETVTSKEGGTPVHDGLTQGNTSFDLDGAKLKMGDTTIKAVINADGTLDSLVINSPFVVDATLTTDFNGTDLIMNVVTSGTYKTNYSFTR